MAGLNGIQDTDLEFYIDSDLKPAAFRIIKFEKALSCIPMTKFYQTHDAKETICIIEDPDGGISIGIARAGKTDLEAGRITSEDGMNIAEGRAKKARKLKSALIEKNYLRGLYAMKIDKGCPK